MSSYANLLRLGACEIREYKDKPQASTFSVVWLNHLADDMEQASLITNPTRMEQAIQMFAHRIVDSGPSFRDLCPSFGIALDALQRQRKKRKS